MIHYAALGEAETACDLPCRAPTVNWPSRALVLGFGIAWTNSHGWLRIYEWDIVHSTTIDPRTVDCPECVANMPDVPACHCGAPALYGAGDIEAGRPLELNRVGFDPGPHWCAEHTPSDCRCLGCAKPLLDASESYCAACLDPDNGDGITAAYGDPAGFGFGFGCGGAL